ncbi:MAG TPA: aldehyde dehydrogenase family protein [Acidimicrobiales bacterium]|nr:aldehyde dehydrogenase family protein [Acidimicrobiales bacterium]
MPDAVRLQVQQTISPIDGSVVAERVLATPQEIDAVLDRATRAQRLWRGAPLDERVAVVERLVPWMVERAGDIGRELTRLMGRPIAHAPAEITRGFAERATWLAAAASGALADDEIGPGPDDPGAAGVRRFIRHEPLGVVLVVAPWNYPYLCSVNAVVPALLAGNAVVLKASSQTPLVAERWAEGLAAAGLPGGVFQLVHADHGTVSGMVADSRVAYVAFTGSVAGGHAVQRAASARFVGAGLELGGKDPAYVRADAPVEATAGELADGVYFNAGQSCCAVERIYVQRPAFDAFVDAFVARARAHVLDDPLDPGTTLGPLVRASAATFVRDQVDEAVAAGARALVDPAGFPRDEPGTPYLAPQVLVGVDHHMRVMTEETFGPVVGIMPVADDDEAVDLMNDSDYGLTASVWTGDVDAALAIGDRVETGTWYLNRADYLDPALAWTGVKDSGRGVSLSTLGFRALTRPKSFHLRPAP